MAEEREVIQNRARAFFFELLMEYRHLPPDDVLSAVLSMSEIRSDKSSGAHAKSAAIRATSRQTPPSASSEHNLRTEEGRVAYDEAVLTVIRDLGGEGLSAKQIREKAGGSSAQFRSSVNRLIEAKKVTFEGQAAGMRYSLTKAAKSPKASKPAPAESSVA